MVIYQHLNSCNLSANSRKLYTRELAGFLGWTELLWGELKMRHLALYKLYLMEEVMTKKGERLLKSTVNSAIASLKSFFSWLVKCYPEVMPTNPMQGVKFEKLPMPPVQSLTEVEMARI